MTKEGRIDLKEDLRTIDGCGRGENRKGWRRGMRKVKPYPKL